MLPTRYTTKNWIKMTELKRCCVRCECTDILERLLVTRPTSSDEKKSLEKKIKIKEEEYLKCLKKKSFT